MSILSEIKVLDVTYGLAGALATHVLSDMGAQITRIDKARATRSPGDLVRLRGRRSIAIDLSTTEGAALADKLIAATDVLLTEPGIDGTEPLVHDFAALSTLNPRLIYCRINGYGDDGPQSHGWNHDHLVAARYGVYDQAGYRDGPTFVTGNTPSLGAALLAVQGIGNALYVRQKSGEGQEVMVSLLAGALAFQPGILSASIDLPGGDLPTPARRPQGAAPFYSIYECADGRYVHLGCLSPAFQRNALKALEIEEEARQLGFGTPEGRENNGRIMEMVAGLLIQRPYADWAALFEAADVPHGESLWTEDLLDDPQVAHEGLAVTLNDPTVGPMTQMGPAVLFASSPWQTPAPAPLAGQDTDAICRELGYSNEDVTRLRREGTVA